MTRSQLITDLATLGPWLASLSATETSQSEVFSRELTEAFDSVISREIYRNGWFEPREVKQSLTGIARWLKHETLHAFSSPYAYHEFRPSLGLILAGNLPMVGFHDVLCGLLSGYTLQIKLSSDDQQLIPLLVRGLIELNPAYAELIQLNPQKLSGFDAVIGTGSDSTLLHFQSYFKEIPHLLRGNRTSIAILRGDETAEELHALGCDIFQYFGRGCRNVTHLIVPEGYSFDAFFEAILPFQTVIQNKKYGNNYDYNRAIHLLSKQPLLDNGFLLLHESTALHPPLAMIHYHSYTHRSEAIEYINQHRDKIQCVSGTVEVPFGTTQQPRIDDFADGINTMEWLEYALK
jgi:hypothetical protein